MNYGGNVLRKLQMTQLEILTYVDDVCRKNQLEYSLYAGTLLGAVRHGGFIPWDDDLDICMPRKDYNRLIALWPTLRSEEYLLQNKENTPGFTQSFTKIRKRESVFLQEYDVGKDYHTGIFIDIFPIDRLPESPVNKRIFNMRVSLYQLMIHEFVPPKGNPLVKLISKLILCVTTKKSRAVHRERLLNKLTKNDDKCDASVVFIETMGTLRQIHEAKLLDDYVYMKFEGKPFMCFANWDEYLKVKYGDYLELPPEDEREWKHKPLQIDFENGPKGY